MIFPATTDYAIQSSQLLLNVIILGTMAWCASGQVQDVVYTDGIGAAPPIIALGITGVLALYNIILLCLQIFAVVVPPVARICVDCLFTIPSYSAVAGMAGWGWSIYNPGPGGWLSCYKGDYTRESCDALNRKAAALFIVAMVAGLIGAILSIADLAISAKVHRASKREQNKFKKVHETA